MRRFLDSSLQLQDILVQGKKNFGMDIEQLMWDRFVDGLIAKQLDSGYAVLDAGMGIGMMGYKQKLLNYKKSFALTGCDIWEEGMNVAKEMGNAYDHIFTHDLEIEEFPYDDNHFDLAIMRGVLAHLTDEGGKFAVKEVQRVSKRQILTFPTTIAHQHDKSFQNDSDIESLSHKSNWQWSDFKDYNLRGFYLKGRAKQTLFDTWTYPLIYSLTAMNKRFCRFTQYVVAWN